MKNLFSFSKSQNTIPIKLERAFLFYLLFFLLLTAYCLLPTAFAQAPPGINYQAVARDASGNPLASQTVSVTFRIRQTSSTGTVVYRGAETYTTNQFGLFTALIGQTASDSGNFSSISWGSDVFYLQVLVNGNNMGATQFMSVPYALYSGTSGPSGPTGPTGLNGATGATGTAGTNGTNGTTGATGATGATGTFGVSGTTGQTIYHNGSTWASTSNLYHNGTDVGIGTTTPGAKLEVFKNSGAGLPDANPTSNAPVIRMNRQTSATATYSGQYLGSIQFTGKNYSWTQYDAASINAIVTSVNYGTDSLAADMMFHTKTYASSLSEKMRITSGGNVGIGTTSPAAKLEVVHTTTVTADAGKFTLNTSASGVKSAVYADVVGTGGGNIFGIYGRSENQALVVSSAAVKGSATGSATATVRYGGDFSANGPGTNFGISAVVTGAATNNIGGYFSASGGTTNYAGIFDQGNVGIGTATPGAKLEIVGSSGATIKIADGNQGANKVLTSDAAGVASWQTPVTSAPGFSNMQVYSTAGTFTFTTGASVTRVMVEVWGGGGGGGTGGGSQYGGSGGGGGYGKSILSITPSTPYTVTVGTGGNGGASGGNAGTNGSASSFGGLISASGGFAGQGTSGSYSGGNGGTSAAAFNITGEKGVGYSGNTTGSEGGLSPLGGTAEVVPGGGANGVVSGAGQNGAIGRVVVWW